MRYFIKLAYNGTNYHGWQTQPNAVSVQETLEKALSLLLKNKIEIVAAGRTDSGVHAKEMFAHFDFEEAIDSDYWIPKLNSYLPKDIVIYSIFEVNSEAHARFDAIERTYEYHIHRRKDAFECHNSWLFPHPLDIDRMNDACKLLLNHTDFECFSKLHTDVKTFFCKLTHAEWTSLGDRCIFTISADRFLRNMVRAIVGTLIDIGTGKTSLDDLEQILASKNRSKAGFSVPAHGLYLTEVHYPYIPFRAR